jgi:hypothetical protein
MRDACAEEAAEDLHLALGQALARHRHLDRRCVHAAVDQQRGKVRREDLLAHHRQSERLGQRLGEGQITARQSGAHSDGEGEEGRGEQVVPKKPEIHDRLRV